MNLIQLMEDLSLRQACNVETRRVDMIAVNGESILKTLEYDETFLVAKENSPFLFIADFKAKNDPAFLRVFNMVFHALYLQFKGELERAEPRMRRLYAESPERFMQCMRDSFDSACNATNTPVPIATREEAIQNELASVAVLCSFAERKVVRYCIRRILEPGVSSSYLYVELEGEVNPADFYEKWAEENPDIVAKYA